MCSLKIIGAFVLRQMKYCVDMRDGSLGDTKLMKECFIFKHLKQLVRLCDNELIKLYRHIFTNFG